MCGWGAGAQLLEMQAGQPRVEAAPGLLLQSVTSCLAHRPPPLCSYYHCSLEQRDDLPEYGAAAGGGCGLLGGPLAWVAGVWGSIKAAAQQQQLQGHLREYLRHSGSHGGLLAAAAHMRLLLGAAGLLAASSGREGGDGGSSALVEGGQELLGVGLQEARGMAPHEWSELVAAAAASAALSTELPACLPHSAARAAADAALQAACGAGPTSGSGGSGSEAADGRACTAGEGEVPYLLRLARSLADAHRLLQHVAVVLHLLPSGPARRQLLALAAPIRQRVDNLEPLLLALPEREGLPPAPPEEALHRAARPASAQREQHTRQQLGQQPRQGAPQGGSGSRGSSRDRGGGGFLGWVLARLYGIEAPSAGAGSAGPLTADEAARLAGLDGTVLLQQVQFAAAVHQQRHAVLAALAVLEADCRALRRAGRSRG